MKLSYQLLKKLILEQVEINKDFEKLRDFAYNKSPENWATAYEIYQRALKKCEDKKKFEDECSQQPIIDYYKEHSKGKLSPQQDQAIKKPEVLIMSNHVNRVDRVGEPRSPETYDEIELFTFYRKPDGGFKEGVPLGKIKVYIYNNEFKFKGEFLGDKNFNEDEKLKLPDDIVQYLNRRGVGDITHEYYDYLNLVLEDYIKGEGKEKYEEYIRGENK